MFPPIMLILIGLGLVVCALRAIIRVFPYLAAFLAAIGLFKLYHWWRRRQPPTPAPLPPVNREP